MKKNLICIFTAENDEAPFFMDFENWTCGVAEKVREFAEEVVGCPSPIIKVRFNGSELTINDRNYEKIDKFIQSML